MAETQVIFRVNKKLLQEFDTNLKESGFKTRNEWFRERVRDFLEEVKRKQAMSEIKKLTAKGITEEEIVKMVEDWRKGN